MAQKQSNNRSVLLDYFGAIKSTNIVSILPEQKEPIMTTGIVLSLLLYFLCTTFIYIHLDSIDFVDALYMSVITFTTVGYGDITPRTVNSRVFTCIYVVTGLMFFASIVDQLVDRIFDYRLAKKFDLLHDLFHYDDHEDVDEDHHDRNTKIHEETSLLTGFKENTIVGYNRKEIEYLLNAFMGSIFSIIILLSVGTFAYSLNEKRSFWDAVYMSCMTVTTVGYGDITPKSNGGKIFTCIYAIICVPGRFPIYSSQWPLVH